jgi:hypothetical protein
LSERKNILLVEKPELLDLGLLHAGNGLAHSPGSDEERLQQTMLGERARVMPARVLAQ